MVSGLFILFSHWPAQQVVADGLHDIPMKDYRF